MIESNKMSQAVNWTEVIDDGVQELYRTLGVEDEGSDGWFEQENAVGKIMTPTIPLLHASYFPSIGEREIVEGKNHRRVLGYKKDDEVKNSLRVEWGVVSVRKPFVIREAERAEEPVEGFLRVRGITGSEMYVCTRDFTTVHGMYTNPSSVKKVDWKRVDTKDRSLSDTVQAVFGVISEKVWD